MQTVMDEDVASCEEILQGLCAGRKKCNVTKSYRNIWSG